MKQAQHTWKRREFESGLKEGGYTDMDSKKHKMA